MEIRRLNGLNRIIWKAYKADDVLKDTLLNAVQNGKNPKLPLIC